MKTIFTLSIRAWLQISLISIIDKNCCEYLLANLAILSIFYLKEQFKVTIVLNFDCSITDPIRNVSTLKQRDVLIRIHNDGT